jgi:trans-2,3-dihydro-3-hydroxyanthranilate isomerase
MSRQHWMARVDVFADRPFAGNPASAVLDAEELSDAEMQAIAGEMKTAGTAFISAATRPEAHFRLRTFTPTREVAYSGHTTLGATATLLDAARLDGDRVVFETVRGLLPVSVDRRSAEPILWLEPPVPACAPFTAALGEVLPALGLEPEGLGDWARAALTPDTDLLLPVRDLVTLHRLSPDPVRLAAIGTALGLRAFCLVSPETVDPSSTIHSRFFAPQYGIPEDVVTGSVHSSLAIWLLEHGRLGYRDGRAAFTAEQGDIVGRPGRIAVEVRALAGRPVAMRVGGRAVVVARGLLRLA